MIIIILGTIYALYKSIKEVWLWWEWSDVPILLLFTGLFTAFGFLVSVGIAVLIGAFIDKEYYMTGRHDLIALRNNSTTEGAFFLGTGYIDENPTYFVLQKENGGTMLKKIDTDNAYVYQAEDKPHYDVFQWRFKNDIFMWIASPCCSTQYKIYIPKDSIISNYKIEL